MRTELLTIQATQLSLGQEDKKKAFQWSYSISLRSSLNNAILYCVTAKFSPYLYYHYLWIIGNF